MYIDNNIKTDKNKTKGAKKADIPDRTKEIPFSKVPVPDVIDLDSTK